MILLTLTNCPSALRGDLTRWLFEVDTNLYVGKQSARIRDEIWQRVISHVKTGRAVMVYPTNNEQGFDFRIWGATWEPIDYDGLKLMLRPHPGYINNDENKLLPGASKVEKRLAAKYFAKNKKPRLDLPKSYIVLDIETTGLNADIDEIIEIGAIKVIDENIFDSFQALIRIDNEIPLHIQELTGITNELLLKEGLVLHKVINNFMAYILDLTIVSHNVTFDINFLHMAYRKCGYPIPTNPCIDTLRLSKKLLYGLPDHKLGTLAKHFNIENVESHRAINDCETTRLLFEQLRLTTNLTMKVNENDIKS